MDNRLKKKWLEIYNIAQSIAEFEPWDYFKESDDFVYIRKDVEGFFHFSFIGSLFDQRGIAVYDSESNYIETMNKFCKSNKKNEPVFLLQNALIALWSDRGDISKDDYNLIKELELKFRGRGAWLHFNKYEIGYGPSNLDEDEVDALLEAFKNLYMMVRAVFEQRVYADFKKGEKIVRWYSEEDKLYYTHNIKMSELKEVDYPVLTVLECDALNEARNMPTQDYSVEIDWAYLDVLVKDGDRNIVPLLFYVVDTRTGAVIYSNVLAPYDDIPNEIFYMFDEIMEKCGKPKQIFVSDKKLEAYLFDLCEKTKIKFSVKRTLPNADKARMFLENRYII